MVDHLGLPLSSIALGINSVERGDLPPGVGKDEISADDLLGDYRANRYYPPRGDLYFDVMTRLGRAAGFDTVESEIMEFEGIRVCVATPSALYRLKKGTVRPLDRQDAEALRQRFGLEKAQKARAELGRPEAYAVVS